MSKHTHLQDQAVTFRLTEKIIYYFLKTIPGGHYDTIQLESVLVGETWRIWVDPINQVTQSHKVVNGQHPEDIPGWDPGTPYEKNKFLADFHQATAPQLELEYENWVEQYHSLGQQTHFPVPPPGPGEALQPWPDRPDEQTTGHRVLFTLDVRTDRVSELLTYVGDPNRTLEVVVRGDTPTQWEERAQNALAAAQDLERATGFG
jgi:hypothetical protein